MYAYEKKKRYYVISESEAFYDFNLLNNVWQGKKSIKKIKASVLKLTAFYIIHFKLFNNQVIIPERYFLYK